MNIWNESDKLWTLLRPVATKCPLCLVLLSCTKVKFMNSLYVARMFPTLHWSIMMGRQNMYQYINIWHFASVMLCMCIILPYCPLTSLLTIQNKWRWQLQWNISFRVKIGWTKLYISPLLLFDLGLCFIHNPLPTLSYTLMPVAFLAQNKLCLVGFWTVWEQGNCHSQVPGSMETVTFNQISFKHFKRNYYFRGHKKKNFYVTIWNQKIYESNLQNCSSQSEPLYTAATPLHFSCFLCQTQLIDHIKQIEIQLLAGGHERITFGDNRVKGRGTPLEQIIDCEYEIKVMLSVFLRENKSKDQTGKEAGRKQTNCQSHFYCVTNGWLLWILLFIIWL